MSGPRTRGPRPEQPRRGYPEAQERQAPPVRQSRVPTARSVAVQQLIRIDEEGAYAGLVGGSPKLSAKAAARGGALFARAGGDDDEDDGGAENDEAQYDEVAASTAAAAARAGAGLNPQQQRTLKALVAGVTRWRRSLDYTISTLTQQSPDKLEPAMRNVLRLAVFELTHMSLSHHAISEFVDLARRVCGSGEGAASFANGVLRAAVRRMQSGGLPEPEDELPEQPTTRDIARYLAIKHSHPTWLVARWVARFGRQGAEELMRANNRQPTYTVRANPLRGATPASLLPKLRAAGADVAASPLMPAAFLEVRAGLQAVLAEGYVARGECLVQDVSAGLVVGALDPQPGERLLDCCAAPGGKAMFAAARMRGKGSITALDVSAPRLRALNTLAASVGVPPGMIHTVAGDLMDFAAAMKVGSGAQPGVASSTVANVRALWGEEEGGKSAPKQVEGSDPASRLSGDVAAAMVGGLYDRVLLDAPCSGSGVLAKRADMRWRRTHEDMAQLVGLQAQLLDAAASLVKPGGVLVYSTCSIEVDECEEQVAAFLRRAAGAGFGLVPLAAAGVVGVEGGVPAEAVTSTGCMSTLPHVHEGADGAFAARLVRIK